MHDAAYCLSEEAKQTFPLAILSKVFKQAMIVVKLSYNGTEKTVGVDELHMRVSKSNGSMLCRNELALICRVD